MSDFSVYINRWYRYMKMLYKTWPYNLSKIRFVIKCCPIKFISKNIFEEVSSKIILRDWIKSHNFLLQTNNHRRTLYGRIVSLYSGIKQASLHNRWSAPVFIAAIFLRSRSTTLISFSQGSDQQIMLASTQSAKRLSWRDYSGFIEKLYFMNLLKYRYHISQSIVTSIRLR